MKKNSARIDGITFIEAIIAVTIFLFVMFTFIYLYKSFTRLYNYQQAEMNLSNSARIVASELQNMALQANKIMSSHNFSGTTYSTDQDTLVLEIPSVNSSGDIISNKHDYTVFYLTGRNLYELIQSDAASSRQSGLKRLSDSVESIAFTYNNIDLSLATKINAEIKMEIMTRRQKVSHNLNREIYLRNK